MIKPLPDPNTLRWYTQYPAFLAEVNHCASRINPWNQCVSKSYDFEILNSPISFFSIGIMVTWWYLLKMMLPHFFWMGRFSCAAITNSSITFDFYGDRRIWDGSTIRRKLNGNSALYIIMNEHPSGMCYVRTFVYVYDMCAKFSLPFPYVFVLPRKFQFLDP